MEGALDVLGGGGQPAARDLGLHVERHSGAIVLSPPHEIRRAPMFFEGHSEAHGAGADVVTNVFAFVTG